MLDVLEHIEDDGAALTHARRRLKTSGRLLVTVPAYGWLWSTHDDAHHHHRRYTAAMLSQRAHAAGLVISRLGYFNSLLFPLIAGAKIVRKLVCHQGESDRALPPPAVNALLAEFFGLEHHMAGNRLFLFGNFGVGCSFYCMNFTVSAKRFAIVGATATLIHIMVAAGLIEWRGFHPGIANGIAFVAANLASYAANTCWSFKSRISLGTWGRFILVSFAAWLLTMAIAWTVAERGGHYLLGISLVSILVPVLTFVAHQRFTYQQHRR